ncbi:MAG: hypothetical protein NVSMB2_22870 [Chloroflexota bacterium]
MFGTSSRPPHVLVDMTPLEPGGRNGGAGLVAASLVQWLGRVCPEWRFTVLTAAASHAELAVLDASNVERRRVVGDRPPRSLARRTLEAMLPGDIKAVLKRVYWTRRTGPRNAQVAADVQADLLFCPFTVPYFWRAGTPMVSIIYDLQHLTYPEFFSPEQRRNRQQQIDDVFAKAAHIVCISHYVQESVIKVKPEIASRITAVPLCVLGEPVAPDAAILERFALERAPFLVYPANFWPHKNHRRLIEAFRLYRQGAPDDNLRVVCTGAPNALMAELRAHAMSTVADAFVFPGYVRPEELGALIDASTGLIFPSLYEGFGMPVLEAMSRRKLVLCSNVTSLPEVAGDGAVYFDPTDPSAIARAIGRVRVASADLHTLIDRAAARAHALGGPRELAERYRDILQASLTAPATAAT